MTPDPEKTELRRLGRLLGRAWRSVPEEVRAWYFGKGEPVSRRCPFRLRTCRTGRGHARYESRVPAGRGADGGISWHWLPDADLKELRTDVRDSLEELLGKRFDSPEEAELWLSSHGK